MHLHSGDKSTLTLIQCPCRRPVSEKRTVASYVLNESQKHDLNSYPFLRHRESFMLFLLNSKYRSNSVITLRFTRDEKHKYKIQINANWKIFGKKNLIVQQIEKLRRKNTRKPYLPDWTRPLRIQRLIFMGEREFFYTYWRQQWA